MAKIKTHYLCNECQAVHLQWTGRCASCGQWNTLIESEVKASPLVERRTRARASIRDSLSIVSLASTPKVISTGSCEFDRALGGGLTPGSVTLIGGEPGIGKSTLLSQFLGNAFEGDTRALYVSAEESEAQVAQRMARVSSGQNSVGILTSNDIEDICHQISIYNPQLVVIDSIQTISDPEMPSAAGSVNQVKECASRLSDLAKELGISLVLVGHVTKDGNLAGPRVLEHLVDTVAYFEGDRDSTLRVLRVIKHRFGPVGDLGMFEMGNEGLRDISNVTGIHLADRVAGQAGSVVFPALDGRRVLLSEIQALVVNTTSEQPRRIATGLEMNRVLLLLAVLEKKVGVRLHNKDVFLSVTGGTKISDPAADLAVLVAVVSSLSDKPVDSRTVFVGEVGLGGEIRSASSAKQRLSEAGRLGFTKGIVGINFADDVSGSGICPLPAADLKAALSAASLSFR